LKQREIKIYCIKVTTAPIIQQQYKEIIEHFYNRLNMDKDKTTEIEYYTKGFIEPPRGGNFVIQKSPNSKDYYEKWDKE
jgi:hypothetical protein